MPVLIFYTEPGTSNYPQDSPFHYLGPGLWSFMHDEPVGTASTLAEEDYVACVQCATSANMFQRITRGGYKFYTTGFDPLWTINYAILSIYVTSRLITFTNGVGELTEVLVADLINCPTMHDACYDMFKHSTFPIHATKWLTDIVPNQYNDFTMPAAAVKVNDMSAYSVRISWDFDDIPPTWQSNAEVAFRGYFADQAGTAQDPKLSVYYTVLGGSGKAYSQTIVV